MSSVMDGGQLVPSEVVLATSQNRGFAGIPFGPSGVQFNFSVPQQVALDAGTSYFMVLEPDQYAANGVNYISFHTQQGFLDPTGAMHFGTDRQLAWQNYPSVADAQTAFAAIPHPVSVRWDPPPFVVGTQYDTPDISAVIQQQVNAEEYIGADETVVVVTAGNAGNFSRIWRSGAFVNPAFRPELRVTYRPPRRIII